MRTHPAPLGPNREQPLSRVASLCWTLYSDAGARSLSLHAPHLKNKLVKTRPYPTLTHIHTSILTLTLPG